MPTQKKKMSESADDQPFKNPSVIINIGAGSTSDISNEILDMFEARQLSKPRIHLVEPSDLDDAFKTVSSDGTDLLVIYGGDGTCKAGAIFARNAAIPLIALPGGTMNMLPKALYGTQDWQAALELALSQNKPRWLVAGNINGEIFFCGALIGEPTVMSGARESLRDGEVTQAIKQIPDIVTAISHGENYTVKVDGDLFDSEANAISLMCPFMSEGAALPDAFEIASAPRLSMGELIGIGARALSQDWRDSVLVNVAVAKSVTVSGGGALDVLLDGEHTPITCPVSVKLEREGVLVLAPAQN